MSRAKEASHLHRQILDACQQCRIAEHRLAHLLVRMELHRLHQPLGFATLSEYFGALGLSEVKARTLLRIGRALPKLPELDVALRDGDIGWTKARELLRVVTPDTAGAWIRRAGELTSRQLENEVSEARTGEPPRSGEPLEPPRPARRRLVFELDASDADAVLDAIAVIRQQTGEDIDRGAVLAMMAARVLHDVEGESAPTPERFRTVVVRCDSCGEVEGIDGEEVSPEVVEQAACDCEELDMRPGPNRGHQSHNIPPSRRRAVLARDGYQCLVPWCRCRLWLDLHHLDWRRTKVDHSEGNLATMCSVHHTMVHRGELAVRKREDETVEIIARNGRGAEVQLGWRGEPRGVEGEAQRSWRTTSRAIPSRSDAWQEAAGRPPSRPAVST